jgi:hypothetical protein
MVHALEKTAGLLVPGGVLIDIHPTTELARVEVRGGGRTVPAGVINETDGGIEYRQADAAVADVLGRGLFRCQRTTAFAFVTYAGSLAELRDHLADAWTDAVIDDTSARLIEDLLAQAGEGGEVLVRERVGMSRLIRA